LFQSLPTILANMNKPTFILSDSGLNKYGFRVLTSGIDISDFAKNPIMLYAHIRGNDSSPNKDMVLPIGRWVNLRFEGDQLLADAEFDEDDEFAMKIAKKVEKGILNTASIGLDPVDFSEDPAMMLPGQIYPTITKSIAKEASIADIPANSRAIKLYGKGATVRLGLSESNPQDLEKIFTINKNDSNKMEEIFITLSLGKNAKPAEAIEAIKKLQDKAREQEATLTLKETEISDLKTRMEEVQKEAKTKAAISLVDAAVSANKITKDERESYIKLAEGDFDSVKKILDSKKGYVPVTSRMATGGKDATLKFSDLRKNNPKYLSELKRNNWEEYARLYQEEYGNAPAR
jgi:hypothetical protein